MESQLPFLLSTELSALYAWRNGTTSLSSDILTDLYLIPGFYFPTLEEAVRMFYERRFSPQWRENWFPFLADGAGDFYAAPCCRESRTLQTEIIGFIHGEPVQETEFLSLENMLKTASLSYGAGIYFMDEDDTLDVDDTAYQALARNLNPGVSIWQS